jgi:hypothetical protein
MKLPDPQAMHTPHGTFSIDDYKSFDEQLERPFGI